jgi:MFS family permease
MSAALRNLVFLAVTCATILSFAATDLVLPAIPSLPRALGGTPAQGQYVLAAFGFGLAGGLLLFGEMGARWDQRRLLVAALLLLAGASFAAGAAASIEALIALRLVQGIAAAAAAAFAPGIIRTIFTEQQAVRAIGLQGSIEALIPALAPILGAWLLHLFAWQASFVLLGVLALLLAGPIAFLPGAAFPPPAGNGGSYLRLLRHRGFLRFALSQACTLGGLLVIVFGAPAVMVGAMGGQLTDFITMQVLGVASFILAANLTSRLCSRFGAPAIILFGSALSALGALALLAYALAGGSSPLAMALLFVPVNMGLGLRGPPGFFQAIVAGGDDNARAAALVILFILLITAGGTVLVAPWIAAGLLPLALVAASISSASVLFLHALRPRRH